MKEYMMVIGSKIIDNDWMELTLIPLSLAKKKKVNLFDLSSMDQILQEVQGSIKQNETKMFLKLEMWNEMELKIGSHVTMEFNVGEI